MALKQNLALLWHATLDLVFPPCCAGCGKVDHILCPDCRWSIEWVAPPFCPRCGRPVLTPVAACMVCASRPLRVDGVRAAVKFRNVIQRAVHAFKYQDRTDLALPLAELMATTWAEGLFPVDCLIPVPLHPGRLRERGYNQSALITKELAKRINLPIISQVLARSRETKTQTELGAAERRQNVMGAFVAHNVQGRSVLLVDDVCTTGSTLEACADALRAAGADRVFAMTLARAGWDPTTGVMEDSRD